MSAAPVPAVPPGSPAKPPAAKLTFKDYKGKDPIWCPGCGDFGVLTALQKAAANLELDPSRTVLATGIGCSSRIPYFISTYGFHGIHGRTMPLATGIRVARPELKTLVFGGDGDAFAIGSVGLLGICVGAIFVRQGMVGHFVMGNGTVEEDER